VPLPTYPFERRRFWIEPKIEPKPQPASNEETAGPHLRTPLWRQALAAVRGPLAAEGTVWLVFPDTAGVGSQILQRLQAERLEPIAVVQGPGFSRISTNSFSLDPSSAADYDALLDAVLAEERPLRIVYLAGLGSDGIGLEKLAAALHRRGPHPPAPSPIAPPSPGRGGKLRLDVIASAVVDPDTGPPAEAGKAPLLGACRGLAAAGIQCRLVDVVPLPPGTPLEGREMRRLIDQIYGEIGEIATPDISGSLIAWRGRRRWVEVWEVLPTAGPVRSRTEGAWLISGDDSEPGHGLAQLLAERPGARVTVAGPASTAWQNLTSSMEHISRAVAPLSRSGRQGGGRAGVGTDALCTSYAVAALRTRGIEPARGTVLSLDELRRRLSLAAGQERLLQALLRMLRDDGILEIVEGGGEQLRFLRNAGEVPPPAELRRACEAETPELRGLFDLLDHCGRHLAGVLSGEVPGLSVLYPDGSSEALARAVRAAESEGPQDAAPLLLRELLGEVLKGRKGPQGLQEREQERPLRILEVGAGQGTLTRELVPVLFSAPEGQQHLAQGFNPGEAGAAPTQFQSSGVEYWFTDVGRSFVLAAEERAYPNMRFRVLDITRDPAAQGFPLGSFDAVLGANVVHATPRIEETLRHLRSLLAPGGLLGLMETVRRHRWADLVWGLTEGWWSFADAPLRTESPLLSAAAWREVLRRAGFEDAQAWPREAETALLLAVRPGAETVETVDAEPPGVHTPGYMLSPSGRHPQPPHALVLLTRDPAALPSLAIQAAEYTQRTDTFATALLAEGRAVVCPAGAEACSPGCEPRATEVQPRVAEAQPRVTEATDLLLALDRALENNLAQISVTSGIPVPSSAPSTEPSPVTAPVSDPSSLLQPSPASLHGRPHLMTSYVAPRTDEEQAIAEIWQKALGIDRVGVHDNFLELGGDSLIGLQVVYAVQSRFALAGRTLNLYEHSTVAAAARFVASGESDGDEAGDSGAADADPFALRSSRGEQRRERRGSYKRTNR
jgi:SAM-dependent methyltransferase